LVLISANGAVNDALAESEERFRRLVEALPDALYVHSEGRIVFVNPFGMRLMGAQQPEQLVGKAISEIIHPDFRELIGRRIQHCYQTGTASPAMEVVLVALDGSLVEVESAGFPMTWQGCQAIEVVVRDIRARKRAEEELGRLRTRTESVLDSVADTHILFDRDWHYLYVNRAAMLAMGRPREQILDRTLWELYPDIVGSGLERQYRRAMEERIPVAFDFHYPTTNTWWENRFYPAPEGLSVFATDITERKRMEHSLQESQAELAHVTRALVMGELVASIAHEVNQPLTAVVTNSNFALREVAKGTPNLEELRNAIAEIVEDGTRASAVISRIRALLKKSVPAIVELDINEVIQGVSILVRNEATRSSVSVILDLASDLPRVLGDQVQLQQVLINLAMNGIDAMRTLTDRPRELLIKSAKHADRVLVQVQDSGTGFDPKHAHQILASSAESVGGLGFGESS
jgi:PAS domain S-box-containing protein